MADDLREQLSQFQKYVDNTVFSLLERFPQDKAAIQSEFRTILSRWATGQASAESGNLIPSTTLLRSGGSSGTVSGDAAIAPAILPLVPTSTATDITSTETGDSERQELFSEPVTLTSHENQRDDRSGVDSASPAVHQARKQQKQSTDPESTIDTISFNKEADIIRLRPTKEQWENFPMILERARQLRADKIGVCKVYLPQEVIGNTSPVQLELQGFKYSVHQNRDVFSIERDAASFTVASGTDGAAELPKSPSLAKDLATQFEQLLSSDSGLEGVRYATDIDIRTEEARAKIGLPIQSPIWPLKGDRLPQTKYRIPGIHWPYGYVSDHLFGAPFLTHIEDYMLYSVNLLYRGEKVWLIIQPNDMATLEDRIQAVYGHRHRRRCSQFVRHLTAFIPTSTLDKWNIRYHVLSQKENEAIITFPYAYHGGFSNGYTIAEAVNYATDLCILKYQPCNPNRCPDESIPAYMMHQREAGEEQLEATNPSEESNMEGDDDDADKDENIGEDQGSNGNEDALPQKRQAGRGSNPPRKKRKQGVQKKTDKTLGRREQPLQTVVPYGQWSRVSDSIAEFCPDGVKAGILVRLFFGIGSPEAFLLLKEASWILRQTVDSSSSYDTDTIAQTIRTLDQVESQATLSGIVRIYCLARLREQYDSLVARNHENIQTSQRKEPRQLKYAIRKSKPIDPSKGKQKAATDALDHLLKEAYPGAEEQNRKSMHNRLQASHWALLAQRYSVDILALIPLGSKYMIFPSDVERIPISIFAKFVTLLDEHRGSFLQDIGKAMSRHIQDVLLCRDLGRRYRFEELNEDSIKKLDYDSDALVNISQVEIPQTQ